MCVFVFVCFLCVAVDENDLIGLAKGVGPDLLKVAPAALAAAPAALPLLAGALGVPGETLYLAGLASFAAGEIGRQAAYYFFSFFLALFPLCYFCGRVRCAVCLDRRNSHKYVCLVGVC